MPGIGEGYVADGARLTRLPNRNIRAPPLSGIFFTNLSDKLKNCAQEIKATGAILYTSPLYDTVKSIDLSWSA
jgi:hypothetical protein